ncbi:hypothetical protein [Streptomyces sp. NBC_01264]|uniref:hypothetical protein n=1 Tax=Streptomyces sp. NBC_01264 TaxID=2903804 RepID=UPI0022566FD1|nr:hypothetical protein [Streptomyces sp. NBC_01264]MCX4778127.1 hypothetical protein [Streptomyces sp. NBC_01264]
MTQPRSAPMPASLRSAVRHPAYDVRCPHCNAAEKARCTTISGRHTKTTPCPARLAAHATATAVCTTCQVVPGTPCHDDGVQRPDTSPVHAARYTEALGAVA